jgi:hypothetical protein
MMIAPDAVDGKRQFGALAAALQRARAAAMTSLRGFGSQSSRLR